MTMPMHTGTRAARATLFAAAFPLLLAAALAHAQAVQVSDAWVRATVPGQKVAAAYMTLRSSAAARLVGVKTKAARSAEIHSMSHEGGVMKMRRLESLELPAGQEVALEPGGNHIMLFDPVKPLEEGQRVALKLVVEQGGKRAEVSVDAPVRSADFGEGAHKHH
jgi:copper(I)-binding protein